MFYIQSNELADHGCSHDVLLDRGPGWGGELVYEALDREDAQSVCEALNNAIALGKRNMPGR